MQKTQMRTMCEGLFSCQSAMYKGLIPAPQAEESSPMSHFSHQGSTSGVRQDGENSTFGRVLPSSLRRCGNRIANKTFVRRYHTSGFSRHGP